MSYFNHSFLVFSIVSFLFLSTFLLVIPSQAFSYNTPFPFVAVLDGTWRMPAAKIPNVWHFSSYLDYLWDDYYFNFAMYGQDTLEVRLNEYEVSEERLPSGIINIHHIHYLSGEYRHWHGFGTETELDDIDGIKRKRYDYTLPSYEIIYPVSGTVTYTFRDDYPSFYRIRVYLEGTTTSSIPFKHGTKVYITNSDPNNSINGEMDLYLFNTEKSTINLNVVFSEPIAANQFPPELADIDNIISLIDYQPDFILNGNVLYESFNEYEPVASLPEVITGPIKFIPYDSSTYENLITAGIAILRRQTGYYNNPHREGSEEHNQFLMDFDKNSVDVGESINLHITMDKDDLIAWYRDVIYDNPDPDKIEQSKLDHNLFTFEDIPVYQYTQIGDLNARIPIYYSIFISNASAIEYIQGQDGEEYIYDIDYFNKVERNLKVSDFQNYKIPLDPFLGLETKTELVTSLINSSEEHYGPIERQVQENFLNPILNNAEEEISLSTSESLKRSIHAERIVDEATKYADQLIKLMLEGLANFISDLIGDKVKFESKDLASAKRTDFMWKQGQKNATPEEYVKLDAARKNLRRRSYLDVSIAAGKIKKVWEIARHGIKQLLISAGAKKKDVDLAMKVLNVVFKATLNIIERQSYQSGAVPIAQILIMEVIKASHPYLHQDFCEDTKYLLQDSYDLMVHWNSSDEEKYKQDRNKAIQKLFEIIDTAKTAIQVTDYTRTVRDPIKSAEALFELIPGLKKGKYVTMTLKYASTAATFLTPLSACYIAFPELMEDGVKHAWGIDVNGDVEKYSVHSNNTLSNSFFIANVDIDRAVSIKDNLIATIENIEDALARNQLLESYELAAGETDSYLDAYEMLDHVVLDCVRYMAGVSGNEEDYYNELNEIAAKQFELYYQFIFLNSDLLAFFDNYFLFAYNGFDDPYYVSEKNVLLYHVSALKFSIEEFFEDFERLMNQTNSTDGMPVVAVKDLEIQSDITGLDSISHSTETFTVTARIVNLSDIPVSNISATLILDPSNELIHPMGNEMVNLPGEFLAPYDGAPETGSDEQALEWHVQFEGDLLNPESVSISIDILENNLTPESFIAFNEMTLLVPEIELFDSDLDGLPDFYERENSLILGENDYDSDPDNDNVPNYRERLNNTNPHDSDTDKDGLTDGEELSSGDDGYITDPNEKDTDQDGVIDSIDGQPIDGGTIERDTFYSDSNIMVSEDEVHLTVHNRVAIIKVEKSGEKDVYWTAAADNNALVAVTPETPDVRKTGDSLIISLPGIYDPSIKGQTETFVSVYQVDNPSHPPMRIPVTIGEIYIPTPSPTPTPADMPILLDFEKGGFDDWEVVNDLYSEIQQWWSIHSPSWYGLDGRALYQGSNAWSSTNNDTCMIGPLIIYTGRKFTNFHLEMDSVSVDNDGIGLVWAYSDTDRHYRVMMINDIWPENPVDGINGPFIKIAKRISNLTPWYELLAYKKEDYIPYPENERSHWKLEVNNGEFHFSRDDELFLDASDDSYSEGYIGIQLYSHQAEFDNISIVPISNNPTSVPSNTPVFTPTPSLSPTPTPTFTPTSTPVETYPSDEIDEMALSQGSGGQTFVNIRNFDPEKGSMMGILRSFKGLAGAFLDVVGGGQGRAVYLSTGDVNDDGNGDIVVSFGPVTAEAVYPNIIVVRDALTCGVIGHSFEAFSSGSGADVNYNGGEVRTAVGDFIQSGRDIIAAAQGVGGNGVVRLFEYTGESAPNGWRIVGQFNGLAGPAKTNNAAGGLTLASGDVDGDGKDELLVGQTNSPTSQTIFHLLDINDSGQVESRIPYAGFQQRFRGNGGVELTVTDLNGDGINEIVAASQGNSKDHSDERDEAPLNLISVIEPIVEGGHVTGFVRPNRSVLAVWRDSINPSGAVSITAIELNDIDDGQELVVGTGSLIHVQDLNVKIISPAPQARYRLIKVPFDGTTVGQITNVMGTRDGYPAFLDAANPASGRVYLGSLNIPSRSNM